MTTPTRRWHAPRRFARTLSASVLVALGGCQLVAVGLSARDDLPKKFDAQYRGLDAAQAFAVMVSADRSIQAEHPAAVLEIAARAAERLRDHYAKQPDPVPGWVPPVDVFAYQYDQPRWYLQPRSAVADDLGVDRLIVLQIDEFRLHEPGNRFEWSGVVAGRVQVHERDSISPDAPAFESTLTVRFPDRSGFTEADMNAQQIASVLVSRFAERSAQLFHDHERVLDKAERRAAR